MPVNDKVKKKKKYPPSKNIFSKRCLRILTFAYCYDINCLVVEKHKYKGKRRIRRKVGREHRERQGEEIGG